MSDSPVGATPDRSAQSAAAQILDGGHLPRIAGRLPLDGAGRGANVAELAGAGRGAGQCPDSWEVSGGSVAHVSRHGPVLSARRGGQRRLSGSTFVSALSHQDKILVAAASGGWLATLCVFWLWWLAPAHRITVFGLVVNSVVLAYVSGFPAFFVASANRLRRVNPSLEAPALRVAFVITHAPSEPWPVARVTLEAMLTQDYPRDYDVWLCSEQPDQEMRDWCARQGIAVSTRSDQPSYHRQTWPRRTKCKEGNLAYFYDRWGYRNYDVVAQLDCDHVPAPDYLAKMVRPFSDPAIGYVAAPSVCDANASRSWAARGRLHKEATFHGAFQLGHSDGLAPLCIGSHYAVRTAAVREIGGIGPDLAEDFSTTFLLNAAGWQGAFAIDAEAHGDGPETFAAMTVQEFQWSRSLTTVLLGLVPLNLRRLSWRLRLRFTYALSYYSLLVTTTVVGLALAPVAAVSGLPWINVNYLAFLAHWWAISIWLIAIVGLLRKRRLLRPPDAPLLSWENWLYSLARWPFVALGIGAAIVQLVRPRPVTFTVTPKAGAGAAVMSPVRLPVKLVIPFAVISAASSAAAIAGEHLTSAAGYVFLSCVGGIVYAVVAAAIPVLHAGEVAASAGSGDGVRRRTGTALRQTATAPIVLASLATAVSAVAVAGYPIYLSRLFGW